LGEVDVKSITKIIKSPTKNCRKPKAPEGGEFPAFLRKSNVGRLTGGSDVRTTQLGLRKNCGREALRICQIIRQKRNSESRQLQYRRAASRKSGEKNRPSCKEKDYRPKHDIKARKAFGTVRRRVSRRRHTTGVVLLQKTA